MTKEITKAIILQQLQDKFKLRDFEPANFLFDETVVPIYDISREVTHTTARYTSKSITAGPAGYLFNTVPPNERWFVNAYNIVFMASGAYTVTGAFIERAKAQFAGSTVYLDMVEGQTVSYAKVLPKAVRLDPGDSISIYVDSYISTAALRLYIDYTVEEVR